MSNSSIVGLSFGLLEKTEFEVATVHTNCWALSGCLNSVQS